ncbi:protein kinase domain-containing protein [Enterobacter kobei]|uniref:protein kinase domain-containing protein n=1 Tax=Enterobacter kobei TaxID=208224 RepID=UPI00249B7D93|nr:protein kinase [Enterobacter kobei]MDI3139171.1 protein kinase [Enterobacter kobei]
MIFEGRYKWNCESECIFAQGGNSFVYQVSAGFMEGDYALKLYKSDDLEGERYKRFLNEIEIAQRISNIDGCVKYVDHGLHGGKPFYVMPFYENGTFRSKFLTSASHKHNAVYILDSFLKVLQIIKKLHQDGLAVRDIKPQNILLDHNDDPVIADFGLSLWLNTCNEERLTPQYGSLGSQGYRPPEWASSYPDPNHRPGDIWSLGRTLWAIFAGKNPPNNYETLGGTGTHLKLYASKEYANLVQSIVTSCTSQNPSKRPDIFELISQVSNIRDEIDNIEENQNQVKRGLKDSLRIFATQLKSSEVYIDSQREESETNIRLNEINECMDILNEKLSSFIPEFEMLIGKDIGSFRVLNDNSEMMFSLNNHGLKIKYSENSFWNKSVCLRFDPSNILAQHKNMSYIYIKFHMGLTEDKEFYWLIASRDQTIKDEYIAEQFETKSLANIVNNKLNQLEDFVIQHFINRIEHNFKA